MTVFHFKKRHFGKIFKSVAHSFKAQEGLILVRAAGKKSSVPCFTLGTGDGIKNTEGRGLAQCFLMTKERKEEEEADVRLRADEECRRPSFSLTARICIGMRDPPSGTF